MKEGYQHQGPDRDSDSRVVVASNLPMTEQAVAYRRAGPPSFIRIFGLVDHPRRVVGKIGAQVSEMQNAEKDSENEEDLMEAAFRGHWQLPVGAKP